MRTSNKTLMNKQAYTDIKRETQQHTIVGPSLGLCCVFCREMDVDRIQLSILGFILLLCCIGSEQVMQRERERERENHFKITSMFPAQPG